MGSISTRIATQVPAASIAPIRREELTQTIRQFLAWLEQSKGLRLCQAFKPQYDWYIPALTNQDGLAREFLAIKTSADPDKPNLERLT